MRTHPIASIEKTGKSNRIISFLVRVIKSLKFFAGFSVKPDNMKNSGIWKLKIKFCGKQLRESECPQITVRIVKPFAISIQAMRFF